jgi:hypothetical protein
MTCEARQSELALLVEGDLPETAAARLRGHLTACSECRGFLKQLEASQAAVHRLAAEPLPEAALGEVRARVAAATVALAARPTRRWKWALAAGLCAAFVGSAAVWMLWRAEPEAAPVASSVSRHAPASTPGAGTVQRPEASVPGLVDGAASSTSRRPPRAPPTKPSALPERTAVSRASARGEEPPAERVATAASPPTGPADARALTPEDADQLARAVVAVSRIRTLADVSERTDPRRSQPARVVRLATPDPNVVIYWQLDSNGG